MNDAEYAAQKARVQTLIDKWVEPLGLYRWAWEYEWFREPIPKAKKAIFQITVRYRYQDVYLKICLPKIADHNDKDLERYFVHEMSHVFTIPLKWAAMNKHGDQAIDALEEHQATELGRSLQWLWKHVEKITEERVRTELGESTS